MRNELTTMDLDSCMQPQRAAQQLEVSAMAVKLDPSVAMEMSALLH